MRSNLENRSVQEERIGGTGIDFPTTWHPDSGLTSFSWKKVSITTYVCY